MSELFGLLGVVVQDIGASVGLGCTPISVIGVGSATSCSAEPVCCQNNNVVRYSTFLSFHLRN